MMATRTDHVIAVPRNGAREFSVRPFADARELWRGALASLPGASLYHSERWLEVLRGAYGLDLWVATVAEGQMVRAACVLARSKNPLARKHFVALPFSDYCEPLAADRAAMATLLSGLANDPLTRGGCELRGLSAPAP